jgi:hypothetical protein
MYTGIETSHGVPYTCAIFVLIKESEIERWCAVKEKLFIFLSFVFSLEKHKIDSLDGL